MTKGCFFFAKSAENRASHAYHPVASDSARLHVFAKPSVSSFQNLIFARVAESQSLICAHLADSSARLASSHGELAW
jgi:hypothetical protein